MIKNFNPFLIIFIIGPTCSNKSKLVNLISKYLPIEIISVDSTHIYKYMNIGTNKPSIKERNNIPHHLIDILDPIYKYSIYKFFLDINYIIINIIKKNKIPILVGGTMLYFNILFNGINIYPKFLYHNLLKNSINKIILRLGNISIYNFYKKNNFFNKNIHLNDSKRIITSLEKIYIYNYFKKNKKKFFINKKKLKFTNIIKFIIYPNNDLKEIIKKKIKFRFYKMLNIGLEKEVNFLFNRGDLNLSLPSMNSIGYKQMWYYFLNKITYNKMIYKSIIATNKLLKNQYTWLKKWKYIYNDIIWLNDINIYSNLSIIMKYINKNNLLY